jgi:hypothetical protein
LGYFFTNSSGHPDASLDDVDVKEIVKPALHTHKKYFAIN